jgi:hypothetical protein
MKIAVIGQCQADAIAKYMATMTGFSVTHAGEQKTGSEWRLPTADLIFAQLPYRGRIEGNVVYFPRMGLTTFHPDVMRLGREETSLHGPMYVYHSMIVWRAWRDGLSSREAVSLFNPRTFAAFNWPETMETGKQKFLAEGRETNLPLENLFERWMTSGGCFMHNPNHSNGRAMADVADALLTREGISHKPLSDPEDYHATGYIWPVYPYVAEQFGWKGSYQFLGQVRQGHRARMTLEQFVEASFDTYSSEPAERMEEYARTRRKRYHDLKLLLALDDCDDGKAAAGTTAPIPPAGVKGKSFHGNRRKNHPYVGLPEHQFWRSAVHADLDPVVDSFTIGYRDKVATAGSCFAQHISGALVANGFERYLTETDPGQGGANYGVYTARYGNIYTARQLLQLFERAYGRFEPADVAWTKGQRFIDPFRPEIEPDGFASIDALLQSRSTEFAAVRRMFEEMDVFIFTFGLTEAWRSSIDGAVFPLAPGVSGGAYDPQKYEFVNFDVDEVSGDFRKFLRRLRKINPRARIILTVSPVPLVATFEPKHVIVSTTYSKSVLRVAAEQIARREESVAYFPSYEIITGSFSRGRYFGKDLRSVTPEGVNHVMRVFLKHFAAAEQDESIIDDLINVVCEEERLLG